ncbi:MAG: hypothetical protein ACTHK5_04195 [Tsuneonella sp.]
MTSRFALALASAALLGAAPSAAQTAVSPPPLTIEQQAALRCSAAFAVGAAMQQRGQGCEWPPLATRGREFFVRVSAQLMDDTGRTREQVAADLAAQARQLGDPAALKATMPACLLMLDAAGIK